MAEPKPAKIGISRSLRFCLIFTCLTLALVVVFSIRSWRHVDIVNIPLGIDGPYISALTYRSGIWVDIHTFRGSYSGSDASIEVFYHDAGFHSLAFQEPFEWDALTSVYLARNGSSNPLALNFPIWWLALIPVIPLGIELARTIRARRRAASGRKAAGAQ